MFCLIVSLAVAMRFMLSTELDFFQKNAGLMYDTKHQIRMRPCSMYSLSQGDSETNETVKALPSERRTLLMKKWRRATDTR